MIRRLPVVLLAVATGLVAAGPAVAQGAGVVVESVEIRSHPDVVVTVSVENQLLGDAPPEFIVSENGVPREATVEAAASNDLKVVLALDVSGSMRGAPIAAAKSAAAQFINQMPSGVEMSIISFGNSPALAAEFTDNKASLLAAVDLLSTGGETALYDGLESAATILNSETGEGRTIILLSDGGDTASSTSQAETEVTLQELGATFYAIELQSPENDSEALQALAAAADGTVIAADDPAALESLFGEIAAELLSSYRLSFTSEAFGPAELSVEVLVSGSTVGSSIRTVDFPAAPPLIDPDPVTPTVTIADAAPAPAPALRPGTPVNLSWWETGAASWLGAAALFAAFATVFTIISLRIRSPRIARGSSTLAVSPDARTPTKKTALGTIAESATSLAEQTLSRGDRFKTVNESLERAGVALRPGEFLVLIASAMLAAGAIGFILLNPLFALGFAVIPVLVAPMWLSSKQADRSEAFNEQLGDTLQLMSASLRAGYGLLQAVDAVAEEAPSPTAEEFMRIKIETHLGRDLDDTLRAAAKRVDSEDFRWVAEAIEIHRQIGGDLAEILDAVNETIRDRNRIRRRIKSLSAEGRISAVILSLIPIVLILVITVINPSYIGELPTTGAGQALIVFGIIAWLGAVAWMRRIVRLIF